MLKQFKLYLEFFKQFSNKLNSLKRYFGDQYLLTFAKVSPDIIPVCPPLKFLNLLSFGKINKLAIKHCHINT